VPKPRLSVESAEIALERNLLSGDVCECGCGELATQWHHLIPQAKCIALGCPEFIDHPDAIVAVATKCHERHTNAFERYPRRLCHRMEQHCDDRMLAYILRTYA
jgi:hypothetical protein